jgi:hypothetical protein
MIHVYARSSNLYIITLMANANVGIIHRKLVTNVCVRIIL